MGVVTASVFQGIARIPGKSRGARNGHLLTLVGGRQEDRDARQPSGRAPGSGRQPLGDLHAQKSRGKGAPCASGRRLVFAVRVNLRGSRDCCGRLMR